MGTSQIKIQKTNIKMYMNKSIQLVIKCKFKDVSFLKLTILHKGSYLPYLFPPANHKMLE